MSNKKASAAALAIAAALGMAACASQGNLQSDMGFFITSVGGGKGADLGGLAGADKHCEALALAAGAGKRTWRAYLSTQSPAWNQPGAIDARDRIGTGPWQNAKGVVVARNVDDLHSPNNNLNKETALDEKGQPVNDRTKSPSKHDILTGSRPDGTAFSGAPGPDMTCSNWTSGGAGGAAMIGHFDRGSVVTTSWGSSWNSSHLTVGCDQASLPKTGGAGLFYCFAAK
jgi:hypothetical protein